MHSAKRNGAVPQLILLLLLKVHIHDQGDENTQAEQMHVPVCMWSETSPKAMCPPEYTPRVHAHVLDLLAQVKSSIPLKQMDQFCALVHDFWRTNRFTEWLKLSVCVTEQLSVNFMNGLKVDHVDAAEMEFVDLSHLSGMGLRTYDSNASSMLSQIADIGYLIHGYILYHFVLQPDAHPWLFYELALNACERGRGKYCVWDVLHGLGHGLLMMNLITIHDPTNCVLVSLHTFNITLVDLNRALTKCSAGPSESHGYLCADGVFMSYFDGDLLYISNRKAWYAPCGRTLYAAPCFRALFTQYAAHRRRQKLIVPLESIFSCHVQGARGTGRACIWGLSLWAFPALDAMCSYPQDDVPTECASNSYPLIFDVSKVWSCDIQNTSLIRWCTRFISDEQDWLACISGSMVLVGQLQRRKMIRLDSFCSQLMLAPLPVGQRRNALSLCIRTAGAFVNNEVLEYMYPVTILEPALI